jgi:hypothetical protein
MGAKQYDRTAMRLTRSDLARLSGFQRAGEKAPTALYGLWRIKRPLLTIGFLAVVVSLIPVALPYRTLALGFTVGPMFSLCAFTCILPWLWPLTRKVLNWDKIEELLKEHDKIV